MTPGGLQPFSRGIGNASKAGRCVSTVGDKNVWEDKQCKFCYVSTKNSFLSIFMILYSSLFNVVISNNERDVGSETTQSLNNSAFLRTNEMLESLISSCYK